MLKSFIRLVLFQNSLVLHVYMYTRKAADVTVAASASGGPCFCKTIDLKKTIIKCSSADCTIKEFHKHCVGLKNNPSKKWLCPNCRVSSKVKET